MLNYNVQVKSHSGFSIKSISNRGVLEVVGKKVAGKKATRFCSFEMEISFSFGHLWLKWDAMMMIAGTTSGDRNNSEEKLFLITVNHVRIHVYGIMCKWWRLVRGMLWMRCLRYKGSGRIWNFFSGFFFNFFEEWSKNIAKF